MRTNDLSFLDLMSIASFVIALQNLEMNITQEDMFENTDRLDRGLRTNVEEIHKHLEEQDRKLDILLSRLEKLDGHT